MSVQGSKHLNFCLIIIFILSFIFVGCDNKDAKTGEEHPIGQEVRAEQEEAVEQEVPAEQKDAADKETVVDKTTDIDQVAQIVDRMTLEEKVGQLFTLAFRKDGAGENITHMNENIKQTIQKGHIGGVVLFSENVEEPTQLKAFITDLQDSSNIPLFISVDEEGGIVSRIAKKPNMGYDPLPNNVVIGNTKDTQKAFEQGQTLGNMLKELGFNMNYAPVADVNTNPNNPVIGVRAYGDDPQLVGDMVAACVQGMQQEGIISVIKHFPGHGDTSTDTHKSMSSVEHTLERLRTVEFLPFKKGIEANVGGIMVAHISLPNVLDNHEPATFSKFLVSDVLKKELKFKGLVTTDALNMGAITNYYSSAEACTRAIEAGIDILLMPEDFELGYEEVLKAVKDGKISEDTIDVSVKKIIKTKIDHGIISKK